MSPESSVEVLKNVVLPAGSDDTSARMFARMIKHGTGAPEALYRGVRLSRGAGGPKAREAVAYWKDRVGRTVDLPFSSFSSDRKVAGRLSSLGRPRERMVFTMRGNMRALHIAALSQHPGEKEWLTGGRFHVTGVDEEPIDTAGVRRTHVEIEQAGVFGLWGDEITLTHVKREPDAPDIPLVLIERFDEIPYRLAGPFDRSETTIFDE